MKTLKLKTLGSCLAATVMSGALAFSAFAADISFDWFKEGPATATAALANEGKTDWGTWACQDGLSTVMSVVGDDLEAADVVLDVDEEAPLSFTMKAASSADKSPIISGTFTFGRAYDAAALPAVTGAKIGLCLANVGGTLKLAYIAGQGEIGWAVSDYVVEFATDPVDVVITVSGTEVTYEVGGETIGVGEISSTDSLSSAEFVGAGSFKTFDGSYTAVKAAKIGDTYYDTLALAAAAVQNGDVVTVLDDNQSWPAPGKRIGYTFGAGTEKEPGYIPTLDQTALNAAGLKGSIKDGAFTAAPNFANGDGLDEATPFQIASKADLLTLKALVDNGTLAADEIYFKQTAAEIDLAGEVWTGIGSDAGNAFVGIYDGDYKSVTNMSLANNVTYNGLFGTVGEGGMIKALRVVAAGFDKENESTAEHGGAAIVGKALAGSEIKECVADGTIAVSNPTYAHYCGGIVAYAEGGVTIDGCLNFATVSTVDGGKAVGQIVGKIVEEGEISASDNNVDLTKGLALGSGTNDGLNFADSTGALVADATVLPADDGVAYTVMSKTPALTDVAIEANQSITFNLNGTDFAPTFAAPTGYKVEPSGTDPITYTCVADKVSVIIPKTVYPEKIVGVVVKQNGEAVEGDEEFKLDPNEKYTITFVAADGYYADPETTDPMDVENKSWTKEELEDLTEAKPYEAEVDGTYYKTIAAAVDAADGAEITVLVDAAWGALAIDADSTLKVVDGNITIAGNVTLVDNYTVAKDKFLGITAGDLVGAFDVAESLVTLSDGSKLFTMEEGLVDEETYGFTNDNVKRSEDPLEDGDFASCFVYELESAAPGPQPLDPSEGTVTKDDDGTYVVTPAEGKTSISIKGAAGLDFKVTDPRDFTITFDAEPKSVKVVNNNIDITSLVKGGTPFSTELDPEKATPAIDTTAETPFAVGDTVTLAVAAEAGLCYRLVRAADLGFADPTIVNFETPTEKTTISLTDGWPRAEAPYYKVIVTKEIIEIE